MLQSMGSQRVGHNLATEQPQQQGHVMMFSGFRGKLSQLRPSPPSLDSVFLRLPPSVSLSALGILDILSICTTSSCVSLLGESLDSHLPPSPQLHVL